MRYYKGIMAIIAKIWSQWAPENDHSQRWLVLDAVPRRPSAHWPECMSERPECMSERPSAMLARAYKATPDVRHSTLHLPSLSRPNS
jgi:hypothetical protein